jgi:hypothetical protein
MVWPIMTKAASRPMNADVRSQLVPSQLDRGLGYSAL